MSCSPQKNWQKYVCPHSPGASRVIWQVTIQFYSMQLFHVVHGAVIPARTSSALSSLLSTSLQYFELSFQSVGRNFWAEMNLYPLLPFSPAPRAARTWCVQYQYPCSMGGLNYISPTLCFPAHPYSVNWPVPPREQICLHRGWMLLLHTGSLPPCWEAKHNVHREPSSSCKIALGWQINIASVVHRLCASPPHTGEFYRGNEILA